MTDSQSDNPKGDRRRGIAPLWWLLALVVAAWLYPKTPLTDWIFCPFRWLTDLRCAGCGMTRSVTSLVRGDWLASLRFHPAGPILLFCLAVVGILRVADRVTNRKVLLTYRERWSRLVTPISVAIIIALIALWAYRLYVDWAI